MLIISKHFDPCRFVAPMGLMDAFGSPEVPAIIEFFCTMLAFLLFCDFILLNFRNMHMHRYLKLYLKDMKFRQRSGDRFLMELTAATHLLIKTTLKFHSGPILQNDLTSFPDD